MATEEQPELDEVPPEPMPWDRLGMFCEDLFTVTRNLATRNQELWASMSHNLGKTKYTADDATTDAAKAMSTAMAGAQDVIDLWIRYPERERVASASTTAFLLFTPIPGDDGMIWTAEEPVWMRLPSSRVERYPEAPTIEISGPDSTVAEALVACLGTKLGKSRQAYLLHTTNVNRLSELLRDRQAEVTRVYTGSVYIRKPAILLANIRIIIEPDPAHAKPPATPGAQ